MFRFSIIFFLVFYGQDLMSREDTLPPPAEMTSDRPVTSADYAPLPPDVLHGVSGMGRMADIKLQTKTGKTIFNRHGSKFILPALFIAYGTAARFNQLPIRRLDHRVDQEIRKYVNRQYDIDDYFQYGMPVLAYGLDFIPGIDSRHNHRDRMLIMGTSLVLMGGIVVTLKSATSVARPGDGNHNSFPSGHTALTMLSAHILYKEYKDVTPWIGICGYLMATTTGVFRMLNYAHWQSDVVAGAGLGLLCAEVGYMILPVWHSILGMKNGECRFIALPAISPQNYGIGFVCRF
ncbi:MAG: phosphatase PAP2 family protein [Tannerella sp.]|jgi:hypothetical protein|nr:phosphatase PAP2 family protein [Tannerella sp.]